MMQPIQTEPKRVSRFHFKNIFQITLLGLVCLGCGSTKDEVEEVDIKAETIIESVPTRLPGEIFIKDNTLIMIDPFSSDGFIRIYDMSDGAEIAKGGILGKGPEEFITPVASQIYEDQLVVFDPNLSRIGYFNIDSIINNRKSLTQIDKSESYEDLIGLIKIDHERSLGIDFGDKPLKIIKPATSAIIEFGKHPIDEELNNGFEVFQGSVKYNADEELIAYAYFPTQHIDLYQKDGDAFKLKWAKEFQEPDFTIVNGTLKWRENQLKGFSDISFTKDYIVTLVNEGMKVNDVGRDIKHMPKTLFVLDYQGNFLRKYHLDIPILRLSTNLSSNTIYAIGINPDFCLIKYNIK